MQKLADREISNIQFHQIFELTSESQRQLERVAFLLKESIKRSELVQSSTMIQIDSVSKFIEAGKRKEILEWISTIRYGNAHESEDKTAMEGTGLWIMEHQIYKDWNGSFITTVGYQSFAAMVACLATKSADPSTPVSLPAIGSPSEITRLFDWALSRSDDAAVQSLRALLDSVSRRWLDADVESGARAKALELLLANDADPRGSLSQLLLQL
jgi:hypothetical protein